MKTWALRFRAADKKNFDALKSGVKSVETRAATEKYRRILPGDILLITCGGEKTKKRVEAVAAYPSIEAMFREIPMEKVMPGVRSLEAAEKEYYGYAGYREKIAEHGLVAFHLTDAREEEADGRVKLVVFVPLSHADAVREAMGNAGAGRIGDYTFCSFSSRGTGRFLPVPGAHPAIGEAGLLEAVEEERIETVCEKGKLEGVLTALRAVHPYEEVAFDIYPLLDEMPPI